MSKESPLLNNITIDSNHHSHPPSLELPSPSQQSNHHHHHNNNKHSSNNHDNNSTESSSSPTYREIFKQNLPPLFKLAFPVVATYILQYSLNITNLIFIGHISAEKLAAAALGVMYVNITGYAIALGFATAVDTLCSQAFGAGSYKLMGLVAQRAAIMLVFITIPIFILWYYCSDILILLRQDPIISLDAGDYVWTMSYSLIPYVWFEVSKKYLINQQLLKPLLYVLVFINLLNILLVYLYIHAFDMGFLGGPRATMTAQWLMLFITIGLCKYKGYHTKSWPPLSKDMFSGWGPIFKLGAMGALMLSAEWWAFELCSLMAGWVGEIELDSFVVLLQLQSLMFMVPMGIGVAVSTITGNHLGAGKPLEAKYVGQVSIILALIIQVMLAFLVFLLRYQIGQLFSNDERVIELVASVAPITSGMLVFDALQAVASGILRGVGLQSIGAVTNLLGYYMIGLPIAVLLVFHYHLHVYGLVTGLLISVIITTATFFGAIAYVNWQSESDKAVKRVKEEKAQARLLNPDLIPPTPVSTQIPTTPTFATSTELITPTEKQAKAAFKELQLERKESEESLHLSSNHINGHSTNINIVNGVNYSLNDEEKQMPV